MGQENSKGSGDEEEDSATYEESELDSLDRDNPYHRSQSAKSQSIGRASQPMQTAQGQKKGASVRSVSDAARVQVEEAFQNATLDEAVAKRAQQTQEENAKANQFFSKEQIDEIKEMNSKVLDKTLALSMHGMTWKSDWRGEKEQMCRMNGAENIQYATDEFFVKKHKEMKKIFLVEVDQELLTSASTQVLNGLFPTDRDCVQKSMSISMGSLWSACRVRARAGIGLWDDKCGRTSRLISAKISFTGAFSVLARLALIPFFPPTSPFLLHPTSALVIVPVL
jgi:hypothetical protein